MQASSQGAHPLGGPVPRCSAGRRWVEEIAPAGKTNVQWAAACCAGLARYKVISILR